MLLVKQGPPRKTVTLAHGGRSLHALSSLPGRSVSSVLCERPTHGQELITYGAVGDQGIHKRHDAKLEETWPVALMPETAVI